MRNIEKVKELKSFLKVKLVISVYALMFFMSCSSEKSLDDNEIVIPPSPPEQNFVTKIETSCVQSYNLDNLNFLIPLNSPMKTFVF